MPPTGNNFDKVFPVTSSFLEIELAVGNVGGRFEVSVDNEAPLSYQAVRERDSSVVLVPLPPHVFDGREHTIFVRSPVGTVIEGSPVRYQSRYQGYLDCLNEGVLVGWAIDFSRPTTPLKIAISVDGRVVALTTADEQRNDLA